MDYFLRYALILIGMFGCFSVTLFTGCSDSQKDSASAPIASSESQDSLSPPVEPPANFLESAYFLCFSQTNFIGTEIRRIERAKNRYNLSDTTELQMNRFGASVIASTVHRETLAADEKLLDFHTTVHMGGAPIDYSGEVDDVGMLCATTKSYGKSELTHVRPPKETFGGTYAVELSLLLHPLKENKIRAIFRYEPTAQAVMLARLECCGVASLPVFSGEIFTFQKIRVTTELVSETGNTPFQSEILYCDGDGKIWARYSPVLDITAWRVSESDFHSFPKGEREVPVKISAAIKEMAATGPSQNNSTSQGFDFAKNANVPVTFFEGVSRRLAECTEATYKIRYLNESSSPDIRLDSLFERTDFQEIKGGTDATTEIIVNYSKTPSLRGDAKFSTGDLAPSNLIQCDDALIMEIAQKIHPDLAPCRELGEALESYVFHFIRDKNYARGFVTAAEVAAKPSGDCTEHAVLFAALARARKIPARIVQGLIFDSESSSMVWHVWNDLYLDGEWISYDSTIGKGHVTSDHLRINSGNFSNETLSVTLLPVAQLIGKVKIEVISVKD